jgi:hypothetical protein
MRSATQEGTRTLPRRARRDAPGPVHHGSLRGLARGRLVADVQDRHTFVTRLGAATTATTRYAGALLPNHAHLRFPRGPPGIPGNRHNTPAGNDCGRRRCSATAGANTSPPCGPPWRFTS